MARLRKKTIHVVSFIIVTMLFLCYFAPVVSAEGSLYISNYGNSIIAGNNGNITIYFDILGTDTMDVIGAESVAIYENGTYKKTYSYTSTSGMMAYDTCFHLSSVTYSGTVGKNYYAYVTYKAGKGGDWDNRCLQTYTVTAKN